MFSATEEGDFFKGISTEDVTDIGHEFRMALHTKRNGGTTFTDRGGSSSLNRAGAQGYDRSTWTWKNIHQTIMIEEDSAVTSKSNTASLVNQVDAEMRGALADIMNQINRAMWMNGDGIISGVQSAGPSKTVTLEAKDGYSALRRDYLFVGQQVDIGTLANPTALTRDEIVNVDWSTPTAPTITLKTNAITTVAGTHFISNAQSRTGSDSLEPNGMRNLVKNGDTTVVGGIDPATNPWWKPVYFDTTNTVPTIAVLRRMAMEVRQRANGKKLIGMGSIFQIDKIKEQAEAQVRWVKGIGGDIKYGAQTEYPEIYGVTFRDFRSAPDTDLYIGAVDTLQLVSDGAPRWPNQLGLTNTGPLQWVPSTTRFEAKLSCRRELTLRDRRPWAAMRNLAQPS